MVERVKPKAPVRPEPSLVIHKVATTQCVHCKHWYVYPCTDPGAELDCSNYKFLQENKKRKRKK